MFKIESQSDDGTWTTDAADALYHGLQEINSWDTHREATAACAELVAVGLDADRLRVIEIVAPTVKDRFAPDWLLQLQRDLSAPVMVPDGAIIDWDQCRDRFLVLLLQRLEKRTTSPHPAIVRRLLEQRLAGEAVTDELFAAYAAAARVEVRPAAWAAAWAAGATAFAPAPNAVALAAAAAAEWPTPKAVERTAQLSDLQAAIAASTQPLAGDQLPPDDDGIEEGIDGPERELLQAFYAATNSEGGSTDQVYLRSIRAVLARAADGFIVPTEAQDPAMFSVQL